jgi:hypothetical protein
MSNPTGIDINASDFLLDGATNFKSLMQDSNFNPGLLHNYPLKPVAVQYKRTFNPATWFGKGRITNWIYRIDTYRYLVYKPFPLDRVATIMGFSRKSMMWHPKAVSMEDYCRYILDNIDPAWLERNNFERV